MSFVAGGSPGCRDGTREAAQFNCPWGICFDTDDSSLIVCDSKNHRIRKVSIKSGMYISLASSSFLFIFIHQGDVTTLCEIEDPTMVEITANRTIIVSSAANNMIFSVTRMGTSLTLLPSPFSLLLSPFSLSPFPLTEILNQIREAMTWQSSRVPGNRQRKMAPHTSVASTGHVASQFTSPLTPVSFLNLSV